LDVGILEHDVRVLHLFVGNIALVGLVGLRSERAVGKCVWELHRGEAFRLEKLGIGLFLFDLQGTVQKPYINLILEKKT
jgi:hypothetical protein